MPSILQQQLQQVSTTWGAPTGKKQRGKPSLLYTAQEAADVDLQTLFELAQEGAAGIVASICELHLPHHVLFLDKLLSVCRFRAIVLCGHQV